VRALVLSVAVLVACSGSGSGGKGGRAPGGSQGGDDTAVAFDCPDAFDRDDLPSRDAVAADIATLVEAGPQSAGDDANERWISGLEARLAAIPGVTVERVPVSVPDERVEAGTLVGTWDGVSTDVPLQAVLPVPGRVDAPSRYIAPGEAPPGDMAGKVALIELQRDGIAVSDLRGALLHESDPRGTLAAQAEYAEGAVLERPWLLASTQTQLDAVVAAGAVGVVLLGDLSVSLAEDLHLGLELPMVPTVLVSDDLARRLRDAARVGTGFHAALDVDAVGGTRTATALRARLGGGTPEQVVLHASSDPLNAVEAGGALALLGVVEALSTLQPGCRPRDLLVDLSPGWRTGFAGASLLAGHLEDQPVAWVGVMAQAGAVEHLPDGAVAQGLVRTGLLEPRFLSVDGPVGLGARVIEQTERDALDRAWVLDRPAGFGAAGTLAGRGHPVVERHSGPWTLPFADRDETSVDPTDLRSDAAWLGGLFLATGADTQATLAAD